MSLSGLSRSGWCLSATQGLFGMAKSDLRDCHFNRMDGRNCARKRFNEMLPTAACKTIDSAFTAPICDISSDGVFIKTTRQFSVGQEVAMTITFPYTGECRMVTGEIVRVSLEGVGINFKVFFKD
jgi:hypothetical protein